MAQLRPRRSTWLGALPRIPSSDDADALKRWAGDLLRVLERGIPAPTRIIETSLNPVAIAANTTAEQTFTVSTLQTGDFVSVSAPTATAGVGIVNARVSAPDTLALTFVNATGGSINPGAETYRILVVPNNPVT